VSDLRSNGRGFDSRTRQYQIVTTWIDDSLHIAYTKVNSAFHPFGVGKSSTGPSGWSYGGARSTVLGGS